MTNSEHTPSAHGFDTDVRRPLRGRYAPSPTGLLHVGNARTALVAWCSARQSGGEFIYRVEDLDPPRTVPGAEDAAVEDLRWLGIDWDEGPDVGGPHAPYRQSERYDLYDRALVHLNEAGHLFPCRVSRRELRELASAPHGIEPAFPRDLRPTSVPDDWFGGFGAGLDAAIRFRVEPVKTRTVDRVQGLIEQDVATETGDFVLKRRDGLFAYQLAVVVDDISMGVTDVVRGSDILPSTGRQIVLTRALGAPSPAYAHVPLVLNASGEKISKRDGELTLASLRDAGVRPDQLIGYLAWSLGLIDKAEALHASEFLDVFRWETIRREDHTLPPHIVDLLRSL